MPSQTPPPQSALLRGWQARAQKEQDWPGACLYMVATPIGNLRDVTLRALDCLSRMDAIASEDTRIGRRLLDAFDIHVKTFALHQHNEALAAQDVIARLGLGERIAFITDAGTPGISDPGARLVKAVRQAGFRVIPLPGPSALATAVSAAGLTDAPLLFLGFLPARAQAARSTLKAHASQAVHIVLYEAPHRIHATLALLCEVFGRDRHAVLARELTKVFETIRAAPLGALFDASLAGESHRGEFVVIVEAEAKSDGAIDANDALLSRLLRSLPLSEAVAITCDLTGAARNTVYPRALILKTASAASEG